MGDIAEATINGELDFYTGEYLDGQSPGYPRTFNGNKVKPLHKEPSKGFSALNGVVNYMVKKGLVVDYYQQDKGLSKCNKIMIKFLRLNKLEYVNKGDYKSRLFNAGVVQKHFETFKKWLENELDLLQ